MEEIWKDIKGYEGLYQVSNFGRVKSLNYRGTGKELIFKKRYFTSGYERVCLTKNKIERTKRVHVLVAEAFIPNPENKPQVNHIDEDKTNNMASNLEWVTPRENLTYGTRMKRVNKLRSVNGYKAKRIVDGEGVIYESVAQASKQLNISRSCLDNVLKGVQKSTKGYTFEYVSEVESNEF